VFRRRPLGRLRPRRLGRLMRAGVTVPEPVRRAMRLREEGRFEEAAGAFDDLSQGAEERGRLLQTANLFAQAARCYLSLEDVDAAYERGLRALDLLKRAGRPGAARRLVEKMIGVLREKGREGEANALERELSQLTCPCRPTRASRRAAGQVSSVWWPYQGARDDLGRSLFGGVPLLRLGSQG